MKKTKRMKRLAWMLALLMMVSLMPPTIHAEAKKKTTKLSSKKITMTAGTTKKIKLLNNSKKVKWSTSNKKVVKITKKSKKYVKVKALKAGNAKITAKVGKKKYVCKIAVKKKRAPQKPTTEKPTKPTTSTTEKPATSTTEKPTTPTTEKPTTPTTEKPATTEDSQNPGGGEEKPVKAYTRIEWMEKLLDAAGKEIISADAIKKDSEGKLLYSYADIGGSEKGLVVETAVLEGILVPTEDQTDETPVFNPEQLASREFAAVTAAKALGYLESAKPPACTDAASLKYPLWDAVAVNIGLIGLQDGYFNGDKGLTGAEANQILAKVKKIKAEETAVPEKVVDIQYTDELVKDSISGLTDYLVTETEIGYRIAVNNYTGSIEETGIEAGKPIYLPADIYGKYPDGFVCCVTGVEVAEQQIMLTGTPLESIFDVVESLQLSGGTIADKIILADGVTLADTGNEETIQSPLDAEKDAVTNGLAEEQIDSKLEAGTISIPDGASTLEKKINDYLTVGLDINAPKINYDIEFDKGKINRFKFVVTNVGTASVSAGVEAGSMDPALKYDMFTIPVQLGGGFEVAMLVSLQVTVSGKVIVTCDITSDLGVDLQRENKVIANFKSDSKMNYEASVSVGPELDIVLCWLDSKVLQLADVNLGCGYEFKSTTSLGFDTQGRELHCRDNEQNIYISVGVGNVQDSVLNKLGLSVSCKIFPWKATIHSESVASDLGPFNKVEKCTAFKGLYGAVLDKNGKGVQFDRIVFRNLRDPIQKFQLECSTVGKYMCKIPDGQYKVEASWDGVVKVQGEVTVEGNTYYDIAEGEVLDSGSGTGYTWSITEDGNFECEIDESADMSGITEATAKYTKLMQSAYVSGTVGAQPLDRLFEGCEELYSVNLAELDTQNVTSMYGMFWNCYHLTFLELGDFNTGNTKSMGTMFRRCNSLRELDLSSFDTSNVTDFRGMFYDCRTLTELDLSNFNTEKAENMGQMFLDCFSLEKVNLSSFSTDSVIDMHGMFQNCRSLQQLDVGHFNTEKLEYMQYMFSGCEVLQQLDVSNFSTASVKDMQEMFTDCPEAIIPDWYKELQGNQ